MLLMCQICKCIGFINIVFKCLWVPCKVKKKVYYGRCYIVVYYVKNSGQKFHAVFSITFG